MNLAFVCNCTGTILVVVAFILHVLCLAMPNYSNADLNNLKDDIKGKRLTDNERQELLDIAAADIKINYGVWKLCFTARLKPDGDCKAWDDKISPGDWLKGVQAMGILGALFLAFGAVLAVLNLVVESRGDRVRLFPYFIAGLCFVGGVLTLIGAIIVTAKYKSVQNLPNPTPLPLAVKTLIGDEFSLSWGFGLDILTVVLACLAGGMHILARNKSESLGLV